MSEPGCVTDGVFQNVKINGSISADNSKSFVMRKVFNFDYADHRAIGKDGVVPNHTHDLTQTYMLPPKCLVLNALVFIKKANLMAFGGGFPPVHTFNIDSLYEAISIADAQDGKLMFTFTPPHTDNGQYLPLWEPLMNETDTPKEFTVNVHIQQQGGVGDTPDETGLELDWTDLGENLIILEYIHL